MEYGTDINSSCKFTTKMPIFTKMCICRFLMEVPLGLMDMVKTIHNKSGLTVIDKYLSAFKHIPCKIFSRLISIIS